MSNVAPCVPVKTATTLPLAAAAARLRRRPGRPRKHPQKATTVVTLPVTSPASAREQKPTPRPSVRETSVPPRLLGVRAAGAYLDVSPWTVRNMLRDGRLCPVRVPGLTRVLVDRHDLDRLIEAWKLGASA